MSATPPCPGCVGERTQVFHVEGLDCGNETAVIERCLRGLAGVCSVRASAVSGQVTVVHTLEPQAILRAFERAGFRARAAHAASSPPASARSVLLACALTASGLLASLAAPRLAVALYLPAILVGGWPIARKGLRLARRGALEMNMLMTLAVGGAMVIGEWAEGATTTVLFAVAQLLEARSLERARRAIGHLMTLAPEQARVRRDGGEERVPALDVAVGETIVVGPGERFPLDGFVVAGTTEADQSPLTGESGPVIKERGDEVFAGSINGSGAVSVQVTRAAAETTLARIIRRVEQAQSSRAPSQGFVESFARVYTPAVVALAFALAVVPPLAGRGGYSEWGYRALVLLVISCPCALVISTPVSIVSALTAASRRGVLIKGGAHLEQMARVRAVLLDKTGTLTRGVPELTDVLPAPGRTRRELLASAAAVESRSGHPLGAAVLSGVRQEGLAPRAAHDIVAFPGRGVEGRVDGQRVLVGSHRLFEGRGLCDHRLDPELERIESEGKTAVLVGLDGGGGRLLGVLGVADALRAEAAEAVRALRAEGVRVGMLTGDNPRTADAIAAQLGIDQRAADLLPEDKVAQVRALTREVGPVAMVGDGVNDAPALAAAAVGIAMGGRGTDAALETADIVLMGDDLRRIPEAIRLGRATRRVIAQNIALSLAVKGGVLALALTGHASLWAAVAADMGASLLVIGNGLRLLRQEPALR